ncbi:MAG: hypothetical protein QM581_15335 [Pseudomonas sp.]
MNASVTVCSRLASPANKLVWSPLVVLALQMLLLPLLALFRNKPHTSNAFAFGSLSLTAIGLLAGLAALPFANRIWWPLRLLLVPAWLVVARFSMIASGF